MATTSSTTASSSCSSTLKKIVTTNKNVSILLHLVPKEHIAKAFAHEDLGYPADEAASLEKLEWRQQNAPDYFLGAYRVVDDARPSAQHDVGTSSSTTPFPKAEDLLGFITSTVVQGALTEEAMGFVHDPKGDNVCIHSGCVSNAAGRKGIGSTWVKEYVNLVEEYVLHERSSSVERISLICKQHLVKFYESAGFRLIGPSATEHGAEQWFDMDLDISKTARGSQTSSEK